MSIQVKTIDVNKAKAEIKKCPKIVRDYVKSLEHIYEISQQTNRKAIEKIRELSKRLEESP